MIWWRLWCWWCFFCVGVDYSRGMSSRVMMLMILISGLIVGLVVFL